MRKVAIYSHSISPSIDGVCRRFTGILKELDRQGYETVLFTLEDEPQDLPAATSVVTLEHMIFPAYPGKKVAKPTLRSFLRIINGLREHRPDVVHVTNDGFSHSFALAGIMLDIPVVGSFHTDLQDLVKSHNGNLFQHGVVALKEFVDSLVLDSCASTSKSFSQNLAKLYIQTQHVIITAVDIKTFEPSRRSEELRKELTFGDPEGFLCVYVGRISREKRIDVIVSAVKQIPGAYLAIIGDGPSAPVYASQHGKANRLYCVPRFLSHEEIAAVYASSDVHVSASEFETLGNTVLEAYACGVPVVVSASQGFCDTVRDSVDGFLFKAGDVSSCRGLLEQLKNNPKLRRAMGDAGRAAVTKKTSENVVQDLAGWYAKGARVKRERSWMHNALIVLYLALQALPLTMSLLFLYDLLVRAWASEFYVFIFSFLLLLVLPTLTTTPLSPPPSP
jgi:glycosyltransferase involved in cell wall biosynthesis